MTGYLQLLREQYAFETVEVRITRPMQQLLNDAAELDKQITDLASQMAALAALRTAKLADFERIKENRQVQSLSCAARNVWNRDETGLEARDYLRPYLRVQVQSR